MALFFVCVFLDGASGESPRKSQMKQFLWQRQVLPRKEKKRFVASQDRRADVFWSRLRQAALLAATGRHVATQEVWREHHCRHVRFNESKSFCFQKRSASIVTWKASNLAQERGEQQICRPRTIWIFNRNFWQSKINFFCWNKLNLTYQVVHCREVTLHCYTVLFHWLGGYGY